VEVTCRARQLEKRLRFDAAGGLTVTYRWDPTGLPEDALFAPEISLAHPLELQYMPDAAVWAFPIATVSKSERGLDETIQGESLTPRWSVALGKARIELSAG
ncbi:MAG: alpha-amylase/4-alpha-glucanotransferase domain-containing protein, partial [Gemmatimonadales bacterium]